jgi:hypothetical protein
LRRHALRAVEGVAPLRRGNARRGFARRFLDHDPWPHLGRQFVLGDQMSGAIDERHQQIEGARAQ